MPQAVVSRTKMQTRRKLDEARYFLDQLAEVQSASERFYYCLSAFLNAWRSVLDVMLYDFVEHHNLGFTREDKITDQHVRAVANALNNNGALQFIEWWRQKQGGLMNNLLWKKRIIIAHRGYPPVQTFTFYVSGSGGTSSTISGYNTSAWSPDSLQGIPTTSTTEGSVTTSTCSTSDFPETEIRFSDYPSISVIDLCERAFDEIESIIEEAERSFGVRL